MSIFKISPTEFKGEPFMKRKSMILVYTLFTTVFILSTLDLLVASIMGDSLFNYTVFVIVDFAFTVLGLLFSYDLVVAKGRESISCFLGYMLFLWACITILKLIILL